jgi:hypothetical protein
MTDANNQINDVLSKLTALGTVIVPLNVITGLWGMNVNVPGQGVQNLHWFFGIVAIMIGLAGEFDSSLSLRRSADHLSHLQLLATLPRSVISLDELFFLSLLLSITTHLQMLSHRLQKLHLEYIVKPVSSCFLTRRLLRRPPPGCTCERT